MCPSCQRLSKALCGSLLSAALNGLGSRLQGEHVVGQDQADGDDAEPKDPADFLPQSAILAGAIAEDLAVWASTPTFSPPVMFLKGSHRQKQTVDSKTWSSQCRRCPGVHQRRSQAFLPDSGQVPRICRVPAAAQESCKSPVHRGSMLMGLLKKWRHAKSGPPELSARSCHPVLSFPGQGQHALPAPDKSSHDRKACSSSCRHLPFSQHTVPVLTLRT